MENCPKCGSKKLWRDEHPDGYAVGLWNCPDCNWYEKKVALGEDKIGEEDLPF